MGDDTCRGYEVDGEPVRVHGGAPLSEEGEAALAEVVRAAKRFMAKEHPHAGVIQELVAAAQHASWCIPEGLVQSRGRNRLMDSFEVRMRLKAAVRAAREALTPASGDVRALAVKALYEKFQPDVGTIAVDAPAVEEWPHLTAIKATGEGLFDWQKLTLGEIVDCLADARLLSAPDVQLAESVHPGEILREELKARGLTQSACAAMVGRSVQVVNRIITGKQSITPDTALDLERGLGVSADFWVRLQADHDLWVARQRREAGRKA